LRRGAASFAAPRAGTGEGLQRVHIATSLIPALALRERVPRRPGQVSGRTGDSHGYIPKQVAALGALRPRAGFGRWGAFPTVGICVDPEPTVNSHLELTVAAHYQLAEPP
jgi:hypothetical protein